MVEPNINILIKNKLTNRIGGAKYGVHPFLKTYYYINYIITDDVVEQIIIYLENYEIFHQHLLNNFNFNDNFKKLLMLLDNVDKHLILPRDLSKLEEANNNNNLYDN